jgi:uncharacterized tellurite resistance protein B-like protein
MCYGDHQVIVASSSDRRSIVAQDSDTTQAGIEALTRCLLVMAGADKTLTLSEIETVSQLYAEACGRPVDPAMIGEIFVQVKNCDAASALVELRAIARQLDDATKERIVRASCSVMAADRKIDRREAERLSEIAAALDIAEGKLPALMRSAGM